MKARASGCRGGMRGNMITIAVDGMGGDNAPGCMVQGAVEALEQSNEIQIRLLGIPERLEEELKQYSYDKSRLEIIPASEVIATEEPPVEAIKKKKDSSLVRGLNMVRTGEADALVTCGSTGATLVGGQVLAGKIKGVRRTPLAPLIPTVNGVTLLVDCGANVDARATDLVQFAQMGSIYMENVLGVKNPRVGIINIGAEEEKGNALVKEAFPLLKACEGINFIGSVEAREIPYGACDVLVTEAFVGNVILKLYEGVGMALIKEIKNAMYSSTRGKVGGLLVKPSLKGVVKKFDASEYGGAPLLGLKGLVVKAHGSSKAKEVKNAILQCVTFKEQRIAEKIETCLKNESRPAEAK